MPVAPWPNYQNPSWSRSVSQSGHCQNQNRNIRPPNCKAMLTGTIGGCSVKTYKQLKEPNELKGTFQVTLLEQRTLLRKTIKYVYILS